MKGTSVNIEAGTISTRKWSLTTMSADDQKLRTKMKIRTFIEEKKNERTNKKKQPEGEKPPISFLLLQFYSVVPNLVFGENAGSRSYRRCRPFLSRKDKQY